MRSFFIKKVFSRNWVRYVNISATLILSLWLNIACGNRQIPSLTDFNFAGAKSLKKRPDGGTWILRWDAVPIPGVEYEIFQREGPPAGSTVVGEQKPYNFELRGAVIKEDYFVSESLLFKGNTCFVVRLKYLGYIDKN
ncbi:MAG: hypothetical protein RL189_3118, partial [Pseudomonadota bacterium]